MMTIGSAPDPPIPFLERLGDALVAAHPVSRRQARRRRLAIGTFAAVMLAVLLTSFAVLRSDPASAAVVVTHDGDVVVVRITNDRTETGEVAKALKDAGVAARVESIPTGPSGAGHFIRLVTASGTAVLRGPAGSGFNIVRFPASTARETVMDVGRPARQGESYTVPTDAYQPAEPLACLPLPGQPATDLVPIVRAKGLDVTWIDPTDQPTTSPPANTYIGLARATSDDRVQIRLTTTPITSPLPAGCH